MEPSNRWIGPVLLVALLSVGVRGCSKQLKVALSPEDEAIVQKLRQEYSSGVIDKLLRTGDYTQSGRLDAEPLRRDAEHLREAKLNRIAEQEKERERTATAGPSVIEGSVAGEFTGFDGNTIIRLMDDSVWEQAEFHWEWHWAYMPRVLVYRSGSSWKMQVEGIRKAVGVRRIR